VATRSKAWSAAARLLGLRVRNPRWAWLSVSCECSLLSGRGLCDVAMTRPEESYRVWCAWVWSWSIDNEEALAHWGLLRHDRWGGGTSKWRHSSFNMETNQLILCSNVTCLYFENHAVHMITQWAQCSVFYSTWYIRLQSCFKRLTKNYVMSTPFCKWLIRQNFIKLLQTV
jgi:hypothetical protein